MDDDAQELIPGIPEEITISHITPQLPWRALSVLSCVSRGWREAIRSRQAYDARVSSRSTETFIALSHLSGDVRAISLYSMRDKSVHQLPGIPQLQGVVPRACQGVVLGGKLYVLGGAKDAGLIGSEEMFVLDLAGQGKWQQCASMQFRRQRFGCSVLDKKIYVFGGTSDWDPVPGPEVYDPEIDAWSSIPPLPLLKPMRFDHHVGTMGGKLYLYGGSVHVGEYYEWKEARLSAYENPFDYECFHAAFDVDVYNPDTQQWSVIDPYQWDFLQCYDERFFMAPKKFHAMTEERIYLLQLHDVSETSWTQLHTVSPSIPSMSGLDTLPVLAVGDQLFAVADWDMGDEVELCLLQCHGFGNDTEEVTWEKVDSSLSFQGSEYSHFMCQLQL